MKILRTSDRRSRNPEFFTPPIVLMTDFGYEDSYAGQMKGVIHTIFPCANIIDLTHGIPPQDILRGALTLLDAFRYFPPASIFVCVVDPGVGTARRILCAKAQDRFFIGPDNGLLSLVLAAGGSRRVRSLERAEFSPLGAAPSHTFHGRDIMAPLAARLAGSRSPSRVFERTGPVVKNWVSLKVPGVKKQSKRCLAGEILFFDHYGNAVTNIREPDASAGFWNRATVRTGSLRIGKIRLSYGDGASRPSKWVALFNSGGRLEIAVPGASSKQAGLKRGQTIRITA